MTTTDKLLRVRALLERVLEADQAMTAGPWTAKQDNPPFGASDVIATKELNGYICTTSGNATLNASGITLYRNVTPAIAKGLLVALDGLGNMARIGVAYQVEQAQRHLTAILDLFPDDV